MSSDELKEKAIKLIRKWDKERGEGWSDDSYEIADIMVEFFKELINELPIGNKTDKTDC